jgi:truncated hemoglobin YjbI
MNDQYLEHWIRLISTRFYDLVYEHEWLKLVFGHVDKELINNQQIAFMLQAFGGPKLYTGRNPGDAHPHIYITEEMWEVRESLLAEAHQQVGAPPEFFEKWKKIDLAFKKQIVMSSPDQCEKRWFTDELIIVSDPRKKSAA